MEKKSFKNFVKEHKKEIITGVISVAGITLLTVIGVRNVKASTAKSDIFMIDNKPFIDMLNTIDEASKDCTHCVPLDLEEVAAVIDKDGIVKDCIRDPEGNLFEVKNFIAFGNKVESNT